MNRLLHRLRPHRFGRVLLLALALGLLLSSVALAHQPYFEEEDVSVQAPWRIQDPTVSTAIYATLDRPEDVDGFAFQARKGQRILIGLTIPQIKGQEDFAPTLAIWGPGLDRDPLPVQVAPSGVTRGLIWAPDPGAAPTFFEPFSRTSYWERQEGYLAVPEDGEYGVAVWHPDGRVGRYVLVVGDRERPGGDWAFAIKIRDYWQPVPAPQMEGKSRPECQGWR